MKLTDSRRLTGPNLILDRPGAGAEISAPSVKRDAAVAAWQSHTEKLLRSVGWGDERISVRLYEGGATVAITAPSDALYAATELIETAWEFVLSDMDGQKAPGFGACVENLKREIADEVDPPLLALKSAAEAHGVNILPDDEFVTLGLGAGSQSWPFDDLPKSKDVDWGKISDVPAALITGTNGKSTTTRIAAAMGKAAGKTVGFSSSDWVKAGDAVIATGDYSGPEGARLALRDTRVDMAVIETARGGLLRRGLPVTQATACLITNIASDHLGEYGVNTVEDLADTKFIVSKAVKTRGTLILNVDDERLKTRGEMFEGHVAWYGLSLTRDDCPQTGSMAFVEDGVMMLCKDGEIIPILPVKDFGPALGGAAQYNVSNALGATLLMSVMGLAPEHLKQGLLDFGSTVEDNPGRGNFLEVGGVKLILDFAHNAHGLRALIQAVDSLPVKRKLYLLGQAGDRSDEDIFDMTKTVADANPECIIIKELPTKLRGRKLGDVPKLVHKYLDTLGYPKAQTLSEDTELEATIRAFEWAQSGDLLVLLVYVDRKEVLELIEVLKSENWQAGQSLPAMP